MVDSYCVNEPSRWILDTIQSAGLARSAMFQILRTKIYRYGIAYVKFDWPKLQIAKSGSNMSRFSGSAIDEVIR